MSRFCLLTAQDRLVDLSVTISALIGVLLQPCQVAMNILPQRQQKPSLKSTILRVGNYREIQR